MKMDLHFRNLVFLRPDSFTLTEFPTKFQVLTVSGSGRTGVGRKRENQATRHRASAWLSIFPESLPMRSAPKPRMQKCQTGRPGHPFERDRHWSSSTDTEMFIQHLVKLIQNAFYRNKARLAVSCLLTAKEKRHPMHLGTLGDVLLMAVFA